VKVLEMLEAGVPVVSTPVGAEGIPEGPLLTVSSLAGMVAAIERHWTGHALPTSALAEMQARQPLDVHSA
jgi:hypothetical protein